jgi:hypothetical protein
VPLELPRILPDDWKGGFALLWIVFVPLLVPRQHRRGDHRAAPMASAVFRGKVHVGYSAADRRGLERGGSGSVVGDTTTTMMWIDGVDPASVLDAYVGRRGGDRFLRLLRREAAARLLADREGRCPPGVRSTGRAWGIVAAILVAAIVANVVANLDFNQVLDHFPVIGAAVWVAILARAGSASPTGRCCPERFRARSSCCRW